MYLETLHKVGGVILHLINWAVCTYFAINFSIKGCGYIINLIHACSIVSVYEERILVVPYMHPICSFYHHHYHFILPTRNSWAAEGGKGAWNLHKLPGAITMQIHRSLLPTNFHGNHNLVIWNYICVTAANLIQMLWCNLGCDGTPLHAPSLPSAAHELL